MKSLEGTLTLVFSADSLPLASQLMFEGRSDRMLPDKPAKENRLVRRNEQHWVSQETVVASFSTSPTVAPLTRLLCSCPRGAHHLPLAVHAARRHKLHASSRRCLHERVVS